MFYFCSILIGIVKKHISISKYQKSKYANEGEWGLGEHEIKKMQMFSRSIMFAAVTIGASMWKSLHSSTLFETGAQVDAACTYT